MTRGGQGGECISRDVVGAGADGWRKRDGQSLRSWGRAALGGKVRFEGGLDSVKSLAAAFRWLWQDTAALVCPLL